MRNMLIKPKAEQDEQGRNIITKPFLKKLCEHDELFETPHLNKHLYLHYMSFADIRNLEDFTNLKVLWLENNMIQKIENLQSLTQLRCLYLHHNGISKIENLSFLKQLTTLNLSHNHISVIENLADLPQLEDLNVSYNQIFSSSSVVGIVEVPSIKILDLRENSIQDSEFLLESFLALPLLKCLYLKGNLFIEEFKFYRKSFVGNLKGVVYMDNKAVSEFERITADAWIRGGDEEEKKAKKEFFEQQEKIGKSEEVGVMEKHREKMKKMQEIRDSNRNIAAEERKKLMSSQFEKVEIMLKEMAVKQGRKTEIFERFWQKKSTKIDFDLLEMLLIENEFDFEKVLNVLKDQFRGNVETLRDLWDDHCNKAS